MIHMGFWEYMLLIQQLTENLVCSDEAQDPLPVQILPKYIAYDRQYSCLSYLMHDSHWFLERMSLIKQLNSWTTEFYI